MYRVPLIIDSDTSSGTTKIVSDSLLIALYLDETYPSSSSPIFPKGTQALQAAWTELLNESFLLKFIPLTTPHAIHALRDEREKEYYRRTREAWLKCTLEGYCPAGSEKEEKAWKELWAGLDKVAEMMDRNKKKEGEDGGIWVMGDIGPTWADFTIVSAFVWFDVAGVKGGWDKIKDRNGGRWGKMMEAMKPYMDST